MKEPIILFETVGYQLTSSNHVMEASDHQSYQVLLFRFRKYPMEKLVSVQSLMCPFDKFTVFF